MNIYEIKREIADKKEEARNLIETDLEKAEKITEEVRELQKQVDLYAQIENEEMKEFLVKTKKETEERALRNVVLPTEKFEKRSSSKKLRLDKLVRGMAGKGWEGADREREYYRSMTSSTNSTIIPSELADSIVDIARTNSAILGRIPTVEMESNNLTVAVQTKDPIAEFVEEGDLISESEAVFSKVTMEGKTLAIFIPITEQLLDSAENLESQLKNSCAKAIALALDKALIYGTGEGGEIKGISLYSDINKITHTGGNNYDMLIKGIKETKKSNIVPTDITYSTDVGMDLAMLKDNNGQYIARPKALDQYVFTESNNVKINESYVYDYNCLLLGLHKKATMEWGTVADQFQRLIKGLRIYLRADLAVINQKGITQITITDAMKMSTSEDVSEVKEMVEE